ncbi:YmfQ family protein [Bradyrhizobium elkanii]|uniref:YmfQ family protein n=1 Tax=Bradyrhizobium elkanii TaxID=29448 RepID=UPI0004B548F0|nr:putative phage tail protein [Bradyrhizobium elkanii]
MPDRHVTRSGDDYAEAFSLLLPQGQAWPRDEGSTLMKVVRGLSQIWGVVETSASKLLEIESDPRITIDLLPDWERNWGLPDPCYKEPLTIDDRQRALVQRMTIEGAQSREFFISAAAYIGYSITITEYRPFMVGLDRCGDSRVYGDGTEPMYSDTFVVGSIPVCNPNGDPVALDELSEWPNYGLGPDTIRHYWTVHVHQARLTWFRCSGGQCGVDPHLRIGLATDLECLLRRWKPAHTEIIFDYSGLTPGDPMAGTP